jgi:endonuclease YncB( thermonuclease family)
MTRRTAVTLAALALTTLAACEERRPLIAEDLGEEDLRDVKVVDAEIMIIDGRRIRLSNVEAPALAPMSRCWGEAIAAKEAVAYLQQMVREGRTVEVEPEARRDPIGRTLARVRIDGLDVGDAMYEQSLVARPGPRPFRWCEPMSRSTEGAPPMDPVLAMTR